MNKNKVYTHVSLFSGSGGLDIGLEQAGLHIGDHSRFPEPDPHGMPPDPCHEHPHD